MRYIFCRSWMSVVANITQDLKLPGWVTPSAKSEAEYIIETDPVLPADKLKELKRHLESSGFEFRRQEK